VIAGNCWMRLHIRLVGHNRSRTAKRQLQLLWKPHVGRRSIYVGSDGSRRRVRKGVVFVPRRRRQPVRLSAVVRRTTLRGQRSVDGNVAAQVVPVVVPRPVRSRNQSRKPSRTVCKRHGEYVTYRVAPKKVRHCWIVNKSQLKPIN